MKKTTTNRQSNRRPARERKNPSGVQNQLSKRRSNSASRKRTEKLEMNTTFEQQINEGTEVTTAEAPKNQKASSLAVNLEKPSAPLPRLVNPTRAKTSAISG